MTEKLKNLFLNWKGLEFIHSLKSITKIFLTILALIFLFISAKIQNYFIFGISIVIILLQIYPNNKEYHIKYKEIFEKIKKGKRYENYKDWINFLEKTKGLNSIAKWFFGLFLNKKFKKLISK